MENTVMDMMYHPVAVRHRVPGRERGVRRHAPAAVWPRRPGTSGSIASPRLHILRSCLWLLLLCSTVPALAQQSSPSGERLRALSDRLGVPFGYAARFEFQTLDEIDRYRQITSSEFNIVTPENSLKWEVVQPSAGTFDFTDMDTLRDYADQHAMDLHGHPLVWYRQNPPWVEALAPAELEQAMLEYITTVVSRYAGRVSIWDVVNEPLLAFENYAGDTLPQPPLNESIFLEAMGPDYIDKAFRAARAADPSATLLLNDYNVGWLNPKADAFYELVVELLERDVPLDGVGFQMHLNHTFVDDEGFSRNMQRFADLGLEIYITEFDVGVLEPADYPVQADVYERIIERCLMQPACKAFQIWGVDDFYSWRPFFDPLPYDDNFDEKPAYFAMQRALSSWPVHLEQCEAEDGRIISGDAVFSGTATCQDARLDGGYRSVAIRYRNTGSDTPGVTLQVGDQTLAVAELPPVNVDAGATHGTVVVPLADYRGRGDLRVTLDNGAAEIGLDALLFRDPAGPVLSGSDSGQSGGGMVFYLIMLSVLPAAARRYRPGRRRATNDPEVPMS